MGFMLAILGANPYPGLDMDETFIERLKKGYRLPRPEICSEKMLVAYDIFDTQNAGIIIIIGISSLKFRKEPFACKYIALLVIQ